MRNFHYAKLISDKIGWRFVCLKERKTPLTWLTLALWRQWDLYWTYWRCCRQQLLYGTSQNDWWRQWICMWVQWLWWGRRRTREVEQVRGWRTTRRSRGKVKHEEKVEHLLTHTVRGSPQLSLRALWTRFPHREKERHKQNYLSPIGSPQVHNAFWVREWVSPGS